jgi:hypothetical protein
MVILDGPPRLCKNHNQPDKTQKRSLFTRPKALLLAAIMLATFATSNFSAVSAADQYYPAERTAMAKIVGFYIYNCIKEGGLYSAPKREWFTNDKAEQNYPFQYNATTIYSAYLEQQAGSNGLEDQKINCHENNNALARKLATKWLAGFDLNELYCNYADSGLTSGVYEGTKTDIPCKDNVNYHVRDNDNTKAADYWKSMFWAKWSQYTGVSYKPGGDTWTLTAAEQYYTYSQAFWAGCAGSEVPASFEPKYTIGVVDGNTGDIYTWYRAYKPEKFTSAQNVEVAPVNGAHSEGKSCIDLAKILAPDSGLVWEAANLIKLRTPEEAQKESQAADTGEADPCMQNAGALGYMACPVQDALGRAAELLYGWLSGILVVPADLVSTSSGTYRAWDTFRSFANVIFVIFFLVIVISQITGLGVSNYGIKKSLPRLIAAAILINLSYVICQLAVDISNIVGTSLASFLAGVVGSTNGGLSDAMAGVGAVFAGSAGIGALVLVTLSGGLAALIPLLLFLLSVVGAVLLMVAILAVRQAAVIILVAIAPLAFVAYVLPNANTLFKKWLDMFKAMLIIFPIASALIGFGVLAHNILKSTPEFSNTLIGAFITVAAAIFPFFALPTLIKGSLNGLGALGAKITGLTDKGFGRFNEAGRARRQELKGLRQIGQASWQDKMAKSNNKFLRKSSGLIMGRQGRANAVQAMADRAGKDNMDQLNRDTLAGVTPAAAAMYATKVSGMSYADRQSRLNALAETSAKRRLSSSEIAEGAALSKVADAKQMRSALSKSNLDDATTRAWTDAHMGGGNFGKTMADDPSMGMRMKEAAKAEEGKAAGMLSNIKQNTLADFSAESMSKLDAGKLHEYLANTQSAADIAAASSTVASLRGDSRLVNAMDPAAREVLATLPGQLAAQRARNVGQAVARAAGQPGATPLEGDSGRFH